MSFFAAIRSRWRARSMIEPIDGSLVVTSASAPPDHRGSQDFSLHGVVSGPGLKPVAVEHFGTASAERWPAAGAVLPVRVDRTDPSRIKVLWEQVPTGEELGRRRAEELAERMRRRAS